MKFKNVAVFLKFESVCTSNFSASNGSILYWTAIVFQCVIYQKKKKKRKEEKKKKGIKFPDGVRCGVAGT